MIKSNIKKILHSLGFDLRRVNPTSNPTAQLLSALSHVQADTVFDVGANIGQFASGLRHAGFTGNLVSFDPLTTAHKKLAKSARQDSKWWVHPRVAVGDRDGQVEINISGNSVSSSLLPMLDAHSRAAPSSAYVSSELTPMVRLDSVAPQYLGANSRPFIKIDTQGSEGQVLDGATETLKQTQGVLLELSLLPLYEGQSLWLEMIDRMNGDGFTLWAIQKGFTDPNTGRSLQVDAIFLRA